MPHLKDFDYKLPNELIAYSPKERGESRLLIVERKSGSFKESVTREIPSIIEYPAVVARNITKVVKTRFYGQRESGGRIEFLVLNPYQSSNEYSSLIKRSSKLKIGDALQIAPDAKVEIIGRESSVWRIRIETKMSSAQFFEKYGHTPLPPYIKRADERIDEESYQTVYASIDGSAAAPTAGLHFSDSMIEEIRKRGGDFADIILHVGLGTFESVKEEDVSKHKMHSEYFSVTKSAAEKLNRAKVKNQKIVSIGTTTLRVLETVFSESKFSEQNGMTDIFIYPPYKIESADILLTNFHLPQSTLLMLVSAFAGRELILDAYNYAIERRFRFFSYGDAMLIL
ncbi:MAG: tRNA preQ1(34) S-adenosylmethionine ribosyltransferase-isomerase QueA [bacterium]